MLRNWRFLVPLSLGIIVAAHCGREYFNRWFFVTKEDEEIERQDEKNLSSLDKNFNRASKYIVKKKGLKLSNEQRLDFYALFKQATIGPCNISKPSVLDMVATAKWNKWKALGDLSKDTAKENYINRVQQLDPEFDVSMVYISTGITETADDDSSKDAEGMSMGMAMSVMSLDDNDPRDWQIVEDVFHYASTGNLTKLKNCINSGIDLNSKDDEGRSLLHWAVDREQIDVVNELLAAGIELEAKDGSGMTALHYACNCEHKEMIELLVSRGADINTKDNEEDTPLSMCPALIESILSTRPQ